MAYILNNRKKQSLFSQLELLLESGLDFSRAFRLTISGADKKDTEILSSVFDDVVSGQSLWHAMQRSVTFSPLDYGVVKIGEETGRMPYALHFLADYNARKENQKRMLVSALSYPAITLCIALAVLTFMLAVVVPMFQSVYERMGGELPVMTLIVIELSKALPYIGTGIGTAVCVAAYIGKVFAKSDRYRMIVSSVLLSMPYCGLLIRKYYQTRFCQLGYLLTSSGIPMLKSLAMIETVIGFCPYERSIKRICSEIERGRSFSESLGRYEHLYGRNLVTLLKVGEETNRLDCMLRSQAEAISAELDYEIRQLNNVVEPMMILTIGIIVAFILIAMYLPMFRLGMLIM